jgi:glycosyltransferase involved in cell wall biosynthesis
MQATAEVASGLAVTIVAHDVGAIGGMERQLSELIGGLLERGVEVVVVSRTCALEPHPGLRWIRVPGPARPFVLAFPWFLAAGSLLVRRHRRGVVHTTGAIVLNRADVCTVHYCHRGPVRRLARASRSIWIYRLNAAAARPLSRLAERLLYRRSRVSTLVAVSAGLAAELRSTLPDDTPVEVIPNGVDTQRFKPDENGRNSARREVGLGRDDLLALFVGNEWHAKGLSFAIEAVALTKTWRLVVVGEGDRASHAARAHAIGIGERVTFLGPRADVDRMYLAADALVAPSAYETFSLVVHEAAASGLPIVATSVHGVDDLLADETGGRLVERDATAIANVLEQLTDADLRARMGSAARAAVRDHGWDRVVDSYLGLYETAGSVRRENRHVTAPVGAR